MTSTDSQETTEPAACPTLQSQEERDSSWLNWDILKHSGRFTGYLILDMVMVQAVFKPK